MLDVTKAFGVGKEGTPLLQATAPLPPVRPLSFVAPGVDRAAGELPKQPRGAVPCYAGAALVVLCFATTVERVSFKMLVDRVVPFRYLLVVLMVLIEALLLGVVVRLKSCHGSLVPDAASFPRKKLLVMALLDLTKDLMMILSGAFVPPSLTVLLMQGQLPVSMLLGMAYERSKGRYASSTRVQYTRSHYLGASLIAAAVVLAFAPALAAALWTTGEQGASHDVGLTAFQHVSVYALSVLPASASVLYKEKALTAYRMPLDPYVLNLYVDVYQLLLLAALAPVAYQVQSMGFFGRSDYHDDDSVFGDQRVRAGSLSDGLKCFFAPAKADPAPDPLLGTTGDFVWPSPKRAYCGLALPLLLVYVGVSLLVNQAVDGVLRHGSPAFLYRGVTLATLSAWLVLALLDRGESTALGGIPISTVSMARPSAWRCDPWARFFICVPLAMSALTDMPCGVGARSLRSRRWSCWPSATNFTTSTRSRGGRCSRSGPCPCRPSADRGAGRGASASGCRAWLCRVFVVRGKCDGDGGWSWVFDSVMYIDLT
jgi:hypothetical protein